MPSLSALNEFRDSFENIANEREEVLALDLPLDRMPLPTQEAPPFMPDRGRFSESDIDFSDVMPPEEPASGSLDGGFDFSAFLGSLNTDDGPPAIDDILPDPPEPSFDDMFETPAENTADDLSTDDFLASLGGEDTTSDSGDLPGDDFLSSFPAETGIDDTPADDSQTAEDGLPSDDFFDSLGGGDTATEEDALPTDDGLPTDDFFNSLGGDTPTEEDALPADDGLPADDFFDSLGGGNDTAAEDSLSAGDGLPSEDFFDSLNGDDTLTEDSLPVDDGLPSEDFFDSFPAETPAETGSGVPLAEDTLPAEDSLPNVEFPAEEEEQEEALNLGGERRDGTLTSGDLTEDDTLPDSLGDDALADFPTETPADFSDLGEEPLPDFADIEGESLDSMGEDEEEPQGIDMGGETLDTGDNGNFVLDDLDIDGPGAETESPTESSDVFDDAFATQDFGTDNLGTDDFGGENFGADNFGTDSLGTDDFGGESLGADDFGTSSQAVDDYAGESLETDDFGAESFDTGEDGEESSAMPDFGDFGEEFASESIDLDSESVPEGESHTSDDFGGEEFALPDLEEIFDKSRIAALSTSAEKEKKPGFFKRLRKIREESAAEEEHVVHKDTDEILLTQEELDHLLATLKSYPLNLRVACEEIIAEQVILPQQLSKLVRYLVKSAPARETAELASEILGRQIIIPRGFEKGSGEAWESEKSSFAYIFIHNFLPILRLFAVIAAFLASVIYLGYTFIYIPTKAEGLYQRGYERIPEGQYQRANELFHEAFTLHRKKNWFYRYAEAFRDQRRFMLAEQKYEELLRYYPRDKKGVLDYANLNTYYLLNYEKANRILQTMLLDYAPNDYQGLLAAGDNFFEWANSDPERFFDKYEEARFHWGRILDRYGWRPPVVERMLQYFIRTDNLKEVINLRYWFDGEKDRVLSPYSLAELGGYLLDKQLEEVRGVPNPYVENIESVREMLLQAVREDPLLPEAHYHLARYHNSLRNTYEERLTLENAIRAFNLAETESVRRRLFRVDTHYRYANLLINNREFFPAEDELARGIELYEDFVNRNLVVPSPQLGRLYATMGDLEFFAKAGSAEDALRNYRTAETHGYSPPEIQFRMGAAHYQLQNWGSALEYFEKSSSQLPLNRRVLYALGNTNYRRGNYFMAQGYYDRLLDVLESQRNRLPVLLPNDSPQFLELGERIMVARNNAGVVYEALANQTGDREYRARALSMYAESARAWDSITRNPETMTRMRLIDMPGAPGINQGFLNANNALRPQSDFTPQIFSRIDKDALEPSRWEEMTATGGIAD